MRRIWIPGAKGFVGAALREIAPKPLLTSGHELDIADLEHVSAFAKEHKPTHIINCAAFSQVDPAETKREEAYRANAMGPETLGIVAQEIGAKLLHISTDYVFPGTKKTPLKETDPVDPCNYYGFTKLEGEKKLQAINPDACILRTSWVFGKGGKNFVTKLFELLQTKEELKLVSDQFGRFTYAPDLAQVLIAMMDRSGLYQFANAGVTSKYEFARACREEMEALGFPIKCRTIEPVSYTAFPAPAKRPAYSAFDTSKIERTLHIKPRPWRTCMQEYLHEHAHAH